MWYLKEECSPLESLLVDTRERHMWGHGKAENGIIYSYIDSALAKLPVEEQWNGLSDRCCSAMRGAP